MVFWENITSVLRGPLALAVALEAQGRKPEMVQRIDKTFKSGEKVRQQHVVATLGAEDAEFSPCWVRQYKAFDSNKTNAGGMEDWEQHRLRKLFDDYKSNNFTPDQISRAVRHLARLINSPQIPDAELHRLQRTLIPTARGIDSSNAAGGWYARRVGWRRRAKQRPIPTVILNGRW